jgi:NADH:ubiquinone oxidoreductase subunit
MVKKLAKIISVIFIMKVKIKKIVGVYILMNLMPQKLVQNGTWLRFISVTSPKDNNTSHKWQKLFNGNLTGLDSAYKPRILRTSGSEEDLDSYRSDYKAWKPE